MSFSHPAADLYLQRPETLAQALGRTTHLGIGAHQDDLEIMAYHGIAACYGSPDQAFSGVVVTDGGGSSRAGPYASYSDAEMKSVRRSEQRKAAILGDYACQIQLAHPSAAVKDPSRPEVVEDLLAILRLCRPEVLYLHNPADKHDTHLGVFWRTLTAIRRLPHEQRPKRLLGCEVWRDLDWMCDREKVVLPTDQRPSLAAALVGVFDSQISGGKRYDLGSVGRRLANATYFESHASDAFESATWAMDLSPLVQDDTLEVAPYVLGYVDRFRQDVAARLERHAPAPESR